MAWVTKYEIPFQSLDGVQYKIRINEQSSERPTIPQRLKGAAEPFVTQEDDDTNIFTPIRKQTGYLRVIDETADGSLLETLLPQNNTQKLVQLWSGTYTGTIFNPTDLHWSGFLCSEAYTQPWDKQKKVLEFPVKSLLAAMEDIFLPLSMLGPSTKVASYFISAFNTLGVTPDEVVCISNLEDIVTDMLCIYVNPATFYTEKEISNQGEVTVIEQGFSFYEALSDIASLYGLCIREQNGKLFIVMYDNAAGKIGRARLSWNDMLAIEAGTVTSVFMGVVPEVDLLNSIEFAGVDNVCTFNQGAKTAIVHLSLGGLFPKITLPQTDETADDPITFATHNDCTLFVQPHSPRTFIESTNFFEYERHTLIGASDYATMLQKTLIKGYTSNPYATPTTTHLYTGAFPIRWFYQTGTERVLLKNGLYLNTQYRTQGQSEVVPVNLLYRIDSHIHLEAIDGWMWINFDWHNIIWYSGVSGTPYLFDDAKSVLGYDVISQITMALRVGDKWWNGTDWVQSSTIPPVSFFFNVTNNTINTNKTADINVDEDEGFFIPVTQELSGDVSFYILDFVPVTYNSIYAYCYSHILENLTVKHIRPASVVASGRSSNTYLEEIVASGFSNEETVNLAVGTINNNPPYPCFIKRDISTNIEALEYYYDDDVTETERPEVNLVKRIATQFSEVRRAFTAIKKYTFNALATYYPFEMRYTYLNRKFFGVVRKQSWRDDTQEYKFLEVT